MDEGREKDNTSRKGGLPTLPGLYLSTIQPSQREFYRIHVCEGEDNWRQYQCCGTGTGTGTGTVGTVTF